MAQEDEKTKEILDAFHLKMRVLVVLAETQLKHARENRERDEQQLSERVQDLTGRLQGGRLDASDYSHAVTQAVDFNEELAALVGFSHEEILAEILFISVFSMFDAYLGHLLRSLYRQRPKLLNKLEDKEIRLAELLSRDKQDILNSLVESELDSLLRESYTKMFDKLAKRFDVKTLKGLPNWGLFIECSQRRNLLTHCDGVVSKQYMDVCASEGAKLSPSLSVGQKLSVSKEYLISAIECVTEVGLKLGQVLWRTSGDSVDAADAHLGQLLFELLKREQWTLALRMGEFGQQCAKRSYKRPRKERSVKIILVNHAQAAKWSGDSATATKILDEYDWTGSAFEFRFAVACLKEEWDNAASLMQRIGPNSEFLPLHACVGWPIFRQFRTTTQFRSTFKAMYGVEFADELRKVADEAAKASQGPPQKQKQKPRQRKKKKEDDDACGPNT